MSEYEFSPDWNGYWEQDARNDRDEYDQQVRAVDEDDRDRKQRDVGEQNRLNVQGFTTR